MMSDEYQYPEVMGRPITREQIIEGLRDAYKGMLENERRKDPTLRRYPDMELILDHIEKYGLPAK